MRGLNDGYKTYVRFGFRSATLWRRISWSTGWWRISWSSSWGRISWGTGWCRVGGLGGSNGDKNGDNEDLIGPKEFDYTPDTIHKLSINRRRSRRKSRITIPSCWEELGVGMKQLSDWYFWSAYFAFIYNWSRTSWRFFTWAAAVENVEMAKRDKWREFSDFLWRGTAYRDIWNCDVLLLLVLSRDARHCLMRERNDELWCRFLFSLVSQHIGYIQIHTRRQA